MYYFENMRLAEIAAVFRPDGIAHLPNPLANHPGAAGLSRSRAQPLIAAENSPHACSSSAPSSSWLRPSAASCWPGGKPLVLLHLSEFVVILGVAAGVLVIASPGHVLKEIVHKIQVVDLGQGARRVGLLRPAQAPLRDLHARAAQRPDRPGGTRDGAGEQRDLPAIPLAAQAPGAAELPLQRPQAGHRRQDQARPAREPDGGRTRRQGRRRPSIRSTSCNWSATPCPASASSPPCSASSTPCRRSPTAPRRWASAWLPPSPARCSASSSPTASSIRSPTGSSSTTPPTTQCLRCIKLAVGGLRQGAGAPDRGGDRPPLARRSVQPGAEELEAAIKSLAIVK